MWVARLSLSDITEEVLNIGMLMCDPLCYGKALVPPPVTLTKVDKSVMEDCFSSGLLFLDKKRGRNGEVPACVV